MRLAAMVVGGMILSPYVWAAKKADECKVLNSRAARFVEEGPAKRDLVIQVLRCGRKYRLVLGKVGDRKLVTEIVDEVRVSAPLKNETWRLVDRECAVKGINSSSMVSKVFLEISGRIPASVVSPFKEAWMVDSRNHWIQVNSSLVDCGIVYRR